MQGVSGADQAARRAVEPSSARPIPRAGVCSGYRVWCCRYSADSGRYDAARRDSRGRCRRARDSSSRKAMSRLQCTADGVSRRMGSGLRSKSGVLFFGQNTRLYPAPPLIPPPRLLRHRYHGVLAPNAPLRLAATAYGRDANLGGAQPAVKVPASPAAAPSASRIVPSSTAIPPEHAMRDIRPCVPRKSLGIRR